MPYYINQSLFCTKVQRIVLNSLLMYKSIFSVLFLLLSFYGLNFKQLYNIAC